MTQQTCSNCGHQNLPTAINCENCDALLSVTVEIEDDAHPTTKPISADGLIEPVTTRYIDDIVNADEELKTGKAVMHGDLILIVQQTGKRYHVTGNQLQEVVLGRQNPDTGYIPTVDLSQVEGHKYGVSRRHATLTRRDSLLVLIDHSSTNGTYLNGKRLAPEQPRVVRDNDMIRLGQLELFVAFQKK